MNKTIDLVNDANDVIHITKDELTGKYTITRNDSNEMVISDETKMMAVARNLVEKLGYRVSKPTALHGGTTHISATGSAGNPNQQIVSMLINGDSEKKVLKAITNEIDANYSIRSNDKPINTIFHIAVERGYVEVVNKLISMGANVNSNKGWNKASPLHVAVNKGRFDADKAKKFEIFKLLLTNGANLLIKDGFGNTPLDNAKFMAKRFNVKLFVDYISKHKELLDRSAAELSEIESANKRQKTKSTTSTKSKSKPVKKSKSVKKSKPVKKSKSKSKSVNRSVKKSRDRAYDVEKPLSAQRRNRWLFTVG